MNGLMHNTLLLDVLTAESLEFIKLDFAMNQFQERAFPLALRLLVSRKEFLNKRSIESPKADRATAKFIELRYLSRLVDRMAACGYRSSQ